MEKFRGVCVLLALIVISASKIPFYCGKEEKFERYGPTPAERAVGVVPPTSPWANVRSWMHAAWMSLRIPYSQSEEGVATSPGEVMKDAVIDKGKSTLETAAQSAAQGTREIKEKADAVQIVAETLKRTLSSSEQDQKKEL